MANPERGEMELVCGDQTFVLRLTTNACCELEAKSGKSYEEHLIDWDRRKRVTAFRWLLWACLQDKHANIAATPEAVGILIDQGDPKSLMRVMASFFASNNEEVKKLIAQRLLADPKQDPPTDPPPAQATAGVDSTLMLVGSV